MATTTFNPADLSGITLTGGNLTATGTAQGGVRAVVGSTTGKYYFEFTLNSFSNGNTGAGIINANATLATVAPSATAACLVYPSGTIWLAGSSTGISIGTLSTAGTVLAVALDLIAYRIWFRGPSGNWNGSVSNDPATGVGGISISSIASSSLAVFPGFASGGSGQAVTANFGDSFIFNGAVPAGFTAGYPVTGSPAPPSNTNTYWNAADRVNVTISGNFLTATGGGTYGGVRSVGRQSSGKFYFEHTFATRTNFQTNAGVCTGATVLTKENGATNAMIGQASIYGGSGNIFIGTSSSGTSLGALASGTVIGIALDLNAQLIWFRIAPAGNWNNNASANPATGIGGLSIAGQTNGGVNPVYALASFQISTDIITANFGDIGFTGAVPAGFTAGFPISSSAVLSALATQIAVEEWRVNSPAGLVTQVAIEQWASVGIVSGKFYFEITTTNIVGSAGAGASFGVANTISTYTGIGTNATIGAVLYVNNGSIFVNGVNTGLSGIGACANNDVIGIAVDFDNRKAWFRKSPSGGWNGQVIGSQNPANNTGGVTLPPGNMTPICTFGGTGGTAGNVFTGNFGASTFAGATPFGFASGWPS